MMSTIAAKQVLCVILFVLFGKVFSQDSSRIKVSGVQLSGYVRGLGLIQHNRSHANWDAYTGIHIRLNATKEITPNIQLRVDARSLFWIGYSSAQLPGHSTGFRQTDEYLDLHSLWWKKSKSVAYTNIERLQFKYKTNGFTATVGRQRIHWGMALGWNPNDIFQAGNPFDPDYLERPGIDAVFLQRPIGPVSGIELAIAHTGSGSSRGAWRYFTNQSGNDIQFIAGWFDKQPLVGGGIAGSSGNWSIRAEIQTYLPQSSSPLQLQSVLEADRILPKNNYIRAAVLYNYLGQQGSSTIPLHFTPTPILLMPGKWNGSIGWSREPSLRFRWAADLYFTSADNTIILLPHLEWTFSDQWSASLFAQFMKSMSSGRFSQQVFFRVGRQLFD